MMLFCSLPLYSMAAKAVDSDALQDRLDRMERMLNSSALMDLLERVDGLQREIRELRGQVEVQNHALSRMKQELRDRYPDFDERLQRLEVIVGPGMALPVDNVEIAPEAISSVSESDATSPQFPVQKTPEQSGFSPSLQAMESAPTESRFEASTSDSNQEQQAYRMAFNLLKKGAYKEAITAFGEFLEQYPRGRYADSAQYWLGEAYYVTQQYPLALEEFQKILREYPSSSNFVDALLKVGYAQHELGQKAKAEQTLGDLIEQYPDTTEAHLAKNRLRRIRTGTSP
ncbi:MAG: tol-pal system protein YbgF [Gammaproteobacteria bacterium]|nr:tol-pal system protein YbgF [Gammaproteobacteria bacterium]NNJ84058.1 tol-pal system protein YbgF [Gammaproteobacteria bacterium]